MALTTTTNSSAIAATDTQIVVASATGFAAGYFVQVGQEMMKVLQTYSSGTTIPVLRGRLGTYPRAHTVTSNVTVGTGSDFGVPPVYQTVNFPIAGRTRNVVEVTATSTLTLQQPGSDLVVILNGTNAITLTIPAPSKDMDGDRLTILGNGTAAHVPTFTGGIGGEGSGYDAVTFNSSGPVALEVIACNGVWLAICQPAMTGTVTNLVAGIA